MAPSGAPSGVLLRRRAALFVAVRTLDGLRQPSSWRAARIGRRAESRRRPSAWPARHARRRRSAPHEPAQPVRVPHGSRQLWVYYPIGILSTFDLWIRMARKAMSDAPQTKEKTRTINMDRAAACAGDRVEGRDHHRRHRRHYRHAAPVVSDVGMMVERECSFVAAFVMAGLVTASRVYPICGSPLCGSRASPTSDAIHVFEPQLLKGRRGCPQQVRA